MNRISGRIGAFAAGAGLLALGAALQPVRPDTLEMPGPRDAPHWPDPRDPADIAGAARDGLPDIMPDNLTHATDRSLIFAGAGLLGIMALDVAADDSIEDDEA